MSQVTPSKFVPFLETALGRAVEHFVLVGVSAILTDAVAHIGIGKTGVLVVLSTAIKFALDWVNKNIPNFPW